MPWFAFRHPESVEPILGTFPATDFRRWLGFKRVTGKGGIASEGLAYNLDLAGRRFHEVGVCRRHKKPRGKQSSGIRHAMKTGHAHACLLLLRNTAYSGCATLREQEREWKLLKAAIRL